MMFPWKTILALSILIEHTGAIAAANDDVVCTLNSGPGCHTGQPDNKAVSQNRTKRSRKQDGTPKLVVLGGKTGAESVSTVSVLNLEKPFVNGAPRLTDMRYKSFSMAAENMGDGTMKMCGGNQNGITTAACYDYDFQSNRWYSTMPMSKKRANPVMTRVMTRNGPWWFVSSPNNAYTEYWANGRWHWGPHAYWHATELDSRKRSSNEMLQTKYVQTGPFCQVAIDDEVIFIGGPINKGTRLPSPIKVVFLDNTLDTVSKKNEHWAHFEKNGYADTDKWNLPWLNPACGMVGAKPNQANDRYRVVVATGALCMEVNIKKKDVTLGKETDHGDYWLENDLAQTCASLPQAIVKAGYAPYGDTFIVIGGRAGMKFSKNVYKYIDSPGSQNVKGGWEKLKKVQLDDGRANIAVVLADIDVKEKPTVGESTGGAVARFDPVPKVSLAGVFIIMTCIFK